MNALTPRDSGRRFSEKNGNLAPDKSDWAFEGCAIRSTECPFWPPYNSCTTIHRDGDNLAPCRLRYHEGEPAWFLEIGTKVRCKSILSFVMVLNNFFKAPESD